MGAECQRDDRLTGHAATIRIVDRNRAVAWFVVGFKR
jgi:hypothetical protein